VTPLCAVTCVFHAWEYGPVVATFSLRTSRKTVIRHALFALLLASNLLASPFKLNEQEMSEVLRLSRAITVVTPFLPEHKYIQYALGIYRATEKYQIDPNVLIAITQQETNFRENLPEGAAGEIGICQIRKVWLKDPKFIKEFGRRTLKDLHHPSKSFLYAAWILRKIKNVVGESGTLPYWSYYNAVKFENRLKYYAVVNKNYSRLMKNEVKLANERWMASDNSLARAESLMKNDKVVYLAPKRVEPIKSSTTKTRWIPDALTRLQKQREKTAARDAGAKPRVLHPALVRTAVELNAGDWYGDHPVQD